VNAVLVVTLVLFLEPLSVEVDVIMLNLEWCY